MKLYQYIKNKQFRKRIVSAGLVAAMLLAFPLADGIETGKFEGLTVYATSAKDKRDKAQSDLDNANSQISELQGIQNQINSQLSDKAQEMASILTNQQLLQDDMDDTQNQIDQAEVDLDAAQQKEAEQYAAMKLRIQFMYENGTSDSIWTAILEADGIADMLNRIEYVNKVYDSDREMLNNYQATVQQVADLKSQLEQQYADMESMQASYTEQQTALEGVISDLKAQSADYESQIATAQNLANQYAQTVAQQNAVIKQQEEEAAKKAEEQRKAQEAAQQASASANTSSGSSSNSSSSGSSSGGSSSGSSSSGSGSSSGKDAGGGSGASGIGSAGYLTDDSNNPSSSVSGSAIVSYACQFVGNPYVWGGNSLTEGCDCSGFVHLVMEHFGISSPRYSQSFASWGQPVSYNNMQAGDVVVYPGHVAIYMGNGCIVEAQSTSAGITQYRSVNCHTILAIRRAG